MTDTEYKQCWVKQCACNYVSGTIKCDSACVWTPETSAISFKAHPGVFPVSNILQVIAQCFISSQVTSALCSFVP